MNRSEMTNEQLRLAIAKDLGYCTHFGGTEIYYCGKQEAKENIWRCRVCEGIIVKQSDLPNYPDDNNAAMGLFDEIDEVDIWKDSTGWNCAFGKAFCHGKPFARALSECWLTAKRGNDG